MDIIHFLWKKYKNYTLKFLKIADDEWDHQYASLAVFWEFSVVRIPQGAAANPLPCNNCVSNPMKTNICYVFYFLEY